MKRIERITTFDNKLIEKLFSQTASNNEIIPNKSFFNKNHNIILVSFFEDTPTGYLYAYLLEDPKSDEPSVFLYSIDVFHQFRKKGVATDLINSLIGLAKEYNCRKVFVLTNTSNQAAVKLFKKTGAVNISGNDLLFTYL